MRPARIKTFLVIVLIALALRATLLVAVSANPERMYRRDSGKYLQPAVNLLNGFGFSQEPQAPFTPDTVATPVYPLFIAVLYKLFGESYFAIGLLQVILSAITAGLVYLLGCYLIPEIETRLGGIWFALSLVSITHAVFILTETVFSFLLLGAVGFVVVYWKRGQIRWLLIAGVVMGITILCRPIALYYPLVAAVLIGMIHLRKWKRALSAAAAFLGASVLIVSPWAVRNFGLLGSPTLSTITSHNLLLYNAVSLEADLRGLSQDQVRSELRAQAQKELNARGWSRDPVREMNLYNEMGRGIIFAHPFRYAYVHMKNNLNSLLPNVNELTEISGVTMGGKGTLSVLNQFGIWKAVDHYFEGQTWLLWLLSPFILILVLTYWGMLVGVFKLGQRKAWWPLALLLLTCAYFLLVPGAPSNPRFRLPVMPYISLLAGAGLIASWHWLRTCFDSLGRARIYKRKSE